MRVIPLIVLAAVVFIGQGEACSAQGTPPDKTIVKPGGGRIGTLSPDEARRADRARKRASASKAAPTKAAGTERIKPPAAPARVASRPRTRAPAPAAVVKVDEPRPTRDRAKIVRVRPAVTERRRVAARPDVHRARVQPSRRLLAGGQRWVPRVGAVVPAGVPLYPVPPPDQPEYPEAAPPPDAVYQPYYYPPYGGAPPGYGY